MEEKQLGRNVVVVKEKVESIICCIKVVVFIFGICVGIVVVEKCVEYIGFIGEYIWNDFLINFLNLFQGSGLLFNMYM